MTEQPNKQNFDLDKFFDSAMHEIKSSFGAVFAIIRMLYHIEKRNDTRNLKVAIDNVQAACKNTANIMDNILGYQRFMAGCKMQMSSHLVDIRQMLEKIIGIYRPFAKESNVTIEFNVARNVPYHIVCDEMKLSQIITNLLHNAIKFTNNDTMVTIDVRMLKDQLVIVFKDCGDGITEDIRERMFEPLVAQNPNGLGLGLYIVREFVAAFGGTVEAVNNPIGGATLTVMWTPPTMETVR